MHKGKTKGQTKSILGLENLRIWSGKVLEFHYEISVSTLVSCLNRITANSIRFGIESEFFLYFPPLRYDPETVDYTPIFEPKFRPGVVRKLWLREEAGSEATIVKKERFLSSSHRHGCYVPASSPKWRRPSLSAYTVF